MLYKFKCIVMTLVVFIAVFMARELSLPLAENNYDMGYETNIYEETISVGAFGEENTNSYEFRKDRVRSFKEILNIMNEGLIPLVMYLLSVLCLVDLIKSTYLNFNQENDLIDKTLYILFIVGQMAILGLISYYVLSISFEVLIIWLIIAIMLVLIIYVGPSIIKERKMNRR